MRVDEVVKPGTEAEAAAKILADALRNAARLPENHRAVYLTEEIEAALRALNGDGKRAMGDGG